MPAIPIIGAVAAVGGTVIAAKGLSNAEKAAKQAAEAKAPQVNIADTQAQAQQIAAQNAANSAALEAQYNPGAAELRAGGLQSLLAALNDPNTDRNELASRIMAQAGQPLSSVNAPTAQQFDSALTRQAVEAAARDLALGGQLPQDVRNLVARGALAKSGTVTGGLQLGRDLTTRDLGLTSLDLYNKRLQNAAAIAQQEAALEQANASLRAQNDSLGLQAAGMNLQSEQFGRTNLLNSASFLDQLSSGDFARAFQAAQLGQNIAQPASGLDPGSVANIAIGNQNAAAGQQQNASALAAGVGNQQTALGGQLVGTGLGIASQFYKPTTYAYTSPTTYGATNYVPPSTNYASQLPAVYCWVARAALGTKDGRWIIFRNWLTSLAPKKLASAYWDNGEYFADYLKLHPVLLSLVRALIEGILRVLKIRSVRLRGLLLTPLCEAFYFLLVLHKSPTGNSLGSMDHYYQCAQGSFHLADLPYPHRMTENHSIYRKPLYPARHNLPMILMRLTGISGALISKLNKWVFRCCRACSCAHVPFLAPNHIQQPSAIK